MSDPIINHYHCKVYAVDGTPVQELIANIVAATGGCTTTPGQGWWRMSHGALVHEPVTIVEVHCNITESWLVSDAVNAYINACLKGGQEAVAVWTSGPDVGTGLAIYHEEVKP